MRVITADFVRKAGEVVKKSFLAGLGPHSADCGTVWKPTLKFDKLPVVKGASLPSIQVVWSVSRGKVIGIALDAHLMSRKHLHVECRSFPYHRNS